MALGVSESVLVGLELTEVNGGWVGTGRLQENIGQNTESFDTRGDRIREKVLWRNVRNTECGQTGDICTLEFNQRMLNFARKNSISVVVGSKS